MVSNATVHNIDDRDAVVNIKSADTVNITEARAVNLGGFIGIGEVSYSHDPMCDARFYDEADPCNCDLIEAVRADEREKAAQRVIDIAAVRNEQFHEKRADIVLASNPPKYLCACGNVWPCAAARGGEQA